ncbi:MAG: hypothetical protein WBD64_05840, partial [Candidatus Zixiibacteriota bacterium]
DLRECGKQVNYPKGLVKQRDRHARPKRLILLELSAYPLSRARMGRQDGFPGLEGRLQNYVKIFSNN